MPAIHSVMKRLGFVRLRDYGLVLTPEGRILSIRPAVLDDGLGGRIVGWKDDDLAAMELERWSELGRAMARQPASLPAVATPVAVRPIAPLPGVPRAPVAPLTPKPVVVARAVAPEPVVDEDDWEWTIAIARARAAAEESEQAAAAAQRPSSRRMRADTVPPPTGARPAQVTPPRPVPAAALAMARESVPSVAKKPAFVQAKTAVDAPIASVAAPSTPVATAPMAAAPRTPLIPPPLGMPTPVHPLPVVKPVVPPVNRAFARGPSPATVIPIPRLPKAVPATIAPVVARRPSVPASGIVPIPPAQPRRFAKGTGPVLPSSASASKPDVTANLAVGDETLPSLLLPPVSRSLSR